MGEADHIAPLPNKLILGSYVRELIPPNVGTGPHRKNVQAVTLAVWTTTACLGTGIFYQPWFVIGSNYRAAALGLVFPGAGYLASANPLGYILLVLTLAAIPPALFAVSYAPLTMPFPAVAC